MNIEVDVVMNALYVSGPESPFYAYARAVERSGVLPSAGHKVEYYGVGRGMSHAVVTDILWRYSPPDSLLPVRVSIYLTREQRPNSFLRPPEEEQTSEG